MSSVFRAYVPTVRFDRATIYQVALAAMPSRVCEVAAQSNLVHRKIWAWLYPTGTPFYFDFDIVGSLNGVEVYRQKLAQWWNVGGAGTGLAWVSGFYVVGTSVGAVNEQIFTNIGGGGTIVGVAPWRVNLAADKFYLDIVSVTGAGTAWDAGLFVQSQQGI